MVRDANHFHHFEDGVCSCMDYWRCQLSACQSLHEVHFVYSSMSSGLLT
jgi:hypothetical protein